VQRDVSPAFDLTYLELFFFGRELQDAQADEGIDDTETEWIRTEVDKNPKVATVVFRKHKTPKKVVSDYAQIWFDRQTAVREWQELKNHNPSTAEQEKMLQDHAKRFFKGKVSYLPAPTPP
jgi:hypothetical protein